MKKAGEIPNGCAVCGGTMVYIRGRYPHTDEREVCPTCLAEHMDLIRDISQPDYGQAFQTEPLLAKKGAI